jgi:hypothetical protein
VEVHAVAAVASLGAGVLLAVLGAGALLAVPRDGLQQPCSGCELASDMPSNSNTARKSEDHPMGVTLRPRASVTVVGHASERPIFFSAQR